MHNNKDQNYILFTQNVGPVYNDWSSQENKDFIDLVFNQSREIINALFDKYSMQEPILNTLDVNEVNAYAVKEGRHSFIAVTPGIIDSILFYNEKLLATSELSYRLNIKHRDLSRLTMIFLIGHEAGHLILGHLGSASHNVRAELGNYPNIESDVDSIVEEIAADRFAADFLFNYLNSSAIDFDDSGTLIFSLLSMLSLFRVLGSRGEWMSKFFDSTHPPSEYRSIAACSQFMVDLQSFGRVDIEQTKLNAKNTLEMEHLAYVELSGVGVSAKQREQYAMLLRMETAITQFVIERHHFLHPENTIG
jgi:Peptidase family M48